MKNFAQFLQKITVPLPSWAVSGPVTDESIDKAEVELDITFPQSYRFFLKNYGGILFDGHEILGLAQAPEDENQTPIFGNVVSHTLSRRKDKYYPNHLIPFYNDGMSWEFCLDTRKINEVGENPIQIWGPGAKGAVAKNFEEFLVLLANDSLEY